jgi:hypothetical protein
MGCVASQQRIVMGEKAMAKKDGRGGGLKKEGGVAKKKGKWWRKSASEKQWKKKIHHLRLANVIQMRHV